MALRKVVLSRYHINNKRFGYELFTYYFLGVLSNLSLSFSYVSREYSYFLPLLRFDFDLNLQTK